MHCILFGQATYSVPNFTGTLITYPITNYQNASKKLREHFVPFGSSSAQKYNLAALEKVASFRASMFHPIQEFASSMECASQPRNS